VQRDFPGGGAMDLAALTSRDARDARPELRRADTIFIGNSCINTNYFVTNIIGCKSVVDKLSN
jgi:hypothetical protein